jgi:gas vesicle protein
MEMAKGDKFLAGLIAGAVVGAVAALLLAPKTGKDTRKLLKDQASQLGEKASSSLGEIFGKKPGAGKDAEHTGNGAASRHQS